ncbi:MAG: response regulator transcription factor [Pirellulaceae bacterium]|nr:response regulator transcription factor [Pirellulaceae bacterium]
MATEKQKRRIMLVDDHPLVRHGLSQLINVESDLVVCAEAASGEDALSVVGEIRPDLMVIDIGLKGINGVELIKRIRARQPEVKMLVSSMHDETLYAERALRAGARGYVNKEEAPENVIEAIRQVLDGNVFLSAAMKDRLLNDLIDGGDSSQQSPVETLSDRELEVFTLIGRGLTTREVANRLHLSVKTIETHRDHIRAKMKISSSAELMRHAVQWVLENA